MSTSDLFPDFPPHAHLWIYIAAEPMTDAQRSGLLASLREFFPAWRSHGAAVNAAAEMVHDRFLLVAGYLGEGGVSGCGIDASTRVLREAAAANGIAWDSPLGVYYRTPPVGVRKSGRNEFRRLVETSAIPEQTLVYDPSITTVQALHDGAFERAVFESWIGKLIPRNVAVGDNQV